MNSTRADFLIFQCFFNSEIKISDSVRNYEVMLIPLVIVAFFIFVLFWGGCCCCFYFCFGGFLWFFTDRISFCSPGFPGIGSVDKAGHKDILFKDMFQKPHVFIWRNKHKANSVLGVNLRMHCCINKQAMPFLPWGFKILTETKTPTRWQ